MGKNRDEMFEDEIEEKIEEQEMTREQLAEHLYNDWKNKSEPDLDAEMEELEVRYGRVDPVYEEVFQRIIRERHGH